jgi:hypothetical protein
MILMHLIWRSIEEEKRKIWGRNVRGSPNLMTRHRFHVRAIDHSKARNNWNVKCEPNESTKNHGLDVRSKYSHAIWSLQQLPMCSLLSDSTVLEDKYAITVDYGAESVGDANGCAALANFR